MSIVKRTHHDCSKHYELKNYEKLFSCDGCKMTGYGQRYQCKLCGHELHMECRYPEKTIFHEHFEGSTFTFREEPFRKHCKGCSKCSEYSKCCDACGKDICGFSYHCEKYDLHPCCRKLEKKVLIDDTIFHLRAKVSSKCIWCKKKKISGKRNAPGWSYVSTCYNYHFHVYCMTEMVHEACMKNGEMALDKVELRQLAKSSRNRGSGTSKIFGIIKSLLKIMLAALLGDPTVLISNVFVELVSRGLQ